jgi:hypothetical protein
MTESQEVIPFPRVRAIHALRGWSESYQLYSVCPAADPREPYLWVYGEERL